MILYKANHIIVIYYFRMATLNLRGEKKEANCLFAIKMASSKETYCLCGQPYNIGQFMIECDCCREWFHGR